MRDYEKNEFNVISPINKQQIAELFTYCDPVPYRDRYRQICKKDLLCFLCKFRQGLCDDLLCLMFQYSPRQATSLAISIVKQSLVTRFVVENIGFQAITKQQFIDRHVTDFSNRLYNPDPQNRKVIVYNDCTYLDIEKNSCFKALRQSYCQHKSKHLLKPSMLVASDGYFEHSRTLLLECN